MKKKIYIVLVNFHGFQDTIECLESLHHLQYTDFQIILIDNSDDNKDINNLKAWAEGEYDEIETNFPQYVIPKIDKPVSHVFLKEEDFKEQKFDQKLLIVKAQENRGFAAANNIALRYINQFDLKDSLVWLLNNDTVVALETLQQIIDELKAIPKKEMDLTLFGTPLFEYEKPSRIQAIAGKYHKSLGITSHIGKGLSYDKNLDTNSYNIDYPIGASLVLSAGFLENVGLMNEEYFLFFEELDWVQRAKTIEGDTKVLPVFGVYHKQGKATLSGRKNSKSEFIDLLSLRNRIIFSKKFYKNHVWKVKLFILTITIFKRIISGNFGRIPKIIKLVFTT